MESSLGLEGMSPVVENYIYRGKECDDMSVYEMTMKTRIRSVTQEQKDKYATAHLNGNERYTKKSLFSNRHSRATSHWIHFTRDDMTPVVYGTITEFPETDHLQIGPTFPREDDKREDRQEKRAMLLLVLFKEWRSHRDLKHDDETWNAALRRFQARCSMALTDTSSLTFYRRTTEERSDTMDVEYRYTDKVKSGRSGRASDPRVVRERIRLEGNIQRRTTRASHRRGNLSSR